MAFESADEELVGGHSPVRLLAGDDGGRVGKEAGEKLLDALFDFRAGNVFGIVEVEAEVVILDPALHDGLLPLLGVEQNELVDVPGEEEFRAGVGRLLVGVLDQGGVVGVAAFGRAGQLHFSGQNQFVAGAVNAEVGALPLDALGFLNFGAAEWPVRMVREKGVSPL